MGRRPRRGMTETRPSEEGVGPVPGGPNRAMRRQQATRFLRTALRSGGASRARWAIADQIVSSVTNFSITLVAARASEPREFGAFSVAMALYIFLLWVGRCLVAEPYIVRYGTSAPEERRRASRAALGTSASIGLGAAVLTAVTGLALGSSSTAVFLAMGVSMPGLLVQDACRYVLLADGRPRAATGNDSLWLVVQAVLASALLYAGWAGAVTLTLSFGLGAAVGAVAGLRQTTVLPSVGSTRAWLTEQRDLGIPFLLELLTVTGIAQIALIGIAAVSGIVTVGELRAATVLMSPPTVLFSGLVLVGLTEAVKLRESSLSRLRTLVVTLAVFTSVVTVLWAVGVATLPLRVGRSVLGLNWDAARSLIGPVAILTAANAVTLSVVVGLKGLAAARQSLRARVWAAPVVLAASLVGAWAADSQGAAVGLAAASWFGALLTWWAFVKTLDGEKERQPDEGRPFAGAVPIDPSEIGTPLANG